MAKRKAYKTTKVSVGRSQEVIRKLLLKYKVMRCQFTDDLEAGRIMLRFAKRVNDIPRTVQISLATEGNEKQTYRTLYYWMKSQLEAVDFGLVSFEQMFLAHFEWMLETGEVTTIGDVVLPQLDQQAGGNLLPSPQEDVPEAEWREVS